LRDRVVDIAFESPLLARAELVERLVCESLGRSGQR
jgi:hypothetical protein